MHRLIVIATSEEEKLAKEYHSPILITGVGYGNVYRTMKSIDRDVPLLNLGYAGSNRIPVGSVCRVGRVMNYHPNVRYEEKQFRLDGDTICFSSSDFVTETNIRTPCLFDMELYALLSMGFTDVISFKTVSDRLNYKEYESCLKK